MPEIWSARIRVFLVVSRKTSPSIVLFCGRVVELIGLISCFRRFVKAMRGRVLHHVDQSNRFPSSAPHLYWWGWQQVPYGWDDQLVVIKKGSHFGGPVFCRSDELPLSEEPVLQAFHILVDRGSFDTGHNYRGGLAIHVITGQGASDSTAACLVW